MRGFLSGAVLGAVLSAVGLTAWSYLGSAVSLTPDGAARPETPDETPVPMPDAAGETMSADPPPEVAPPDPMPDMPDADTAPDAEAPDPGEAAPPEAAAPDAEPEEEAPDPADTGPDEAAAPEAMAEDPPMPAPVSDPAPDAPDPDVAVSDLSDMTPPAVPDTETPPEVAPDTPPVPDAPVSANSPAAPGTPEATAATDPPPAEQPAPETPVVTAPDTPAQDVPPEMADSAVPPAVDMPEPAGPGGEEDDAPGILVDRLPRIGDAPEPEEPPAAEEAEPMEADGPAISAFGSPFEIPQGTPVMAILLLDPGPGRPDPAALAAFPIPLTIGIDPQGPDAAAAMVAYRDAGHEVAVLAPLFENASAGDVEQAFQVYLSAVPEAAIVLDVPQARFQESRSRAAQVSAILNETGLGLITYQRGLNSGLQVAEQAGVPATAVFRDFDDGDRDAEAMKRLLDVGAFRAAQEGSAVLIGELRAETISALTEWVLSSRATSVTIAPASALLLSLQ